MARTLIRLFAVALCLGSLWSPVAGSSRLEFPRLALEAGRILGVAMVNPNPEPAAVTLTAFGATGTVLANQELTMAAGSQLSFLASDVFADLDLSQIGWFRADSMSNDLTGFFLYLDPTARELDGADLPVRARSLVFAQIEGSGARSTEINLVNPGLVPASVTARLRTGNQSQQRIFVIPSNGTIQFDPRDFFATDPIAPTGSLEITSDEDLLGFQILRFSNGDSAGLNARSSVQMLNRLYFPQIVLGAGFTNALALRNQSGQEVSVRVTAHDPAGGLVPLPQNPKTILIGAGEVFRTTLAGLFEFEGEEVVTGWLEASASEPSISGELVYRIGEDQAAAAVPAAESGSRRLLFSHLATATDFFTGLAILNPGLFPAALRGVTVSREGEPLGRFDRVLRPGERLSALITELIPEAAHQNGGFIWVEADSPVFATALFGNGRSLLANVPPQPSPVRFRADDAFPPRPVLTPGYAAAAAGETVQFASAGDPRWLVDGVEGGAGGAGLVDAGGLYTAPSPISTSPVSVSAQSEEGVAAAGVDLLSTAEVLVSPGTASAIAVLPTSGRVFFSASPGGEPPAGSGTGHQLFELVEGEAQVVAALGFIPGSISVSGLMGEERLVLVDPAGSGLHLFDPAASSLQSLESGPVTAAVYDPVSRSLLVAEEGRLRGITDPTTTADSGSATSVPGFSLAGSGETITSLAVDRCTSDVLFTTSAGNLGRFQRSLATAQILAEGLPGVARLLVQYRRGVSCPEGTEVLVMTGEQVTLLHPSSQRLFSPWSPLDRVRDLALESDGRILALQQDDEGYRIRAVDNGMVYAYGPVNPPRVELLPVRSTTPGLDLELISTTASSGQSVDFNLFLRVSEILPSALIFSIDLDGEALLFDDSDQDGNGIPDAVIPLLPSGYTLFARYDPNDEDAELAFIIADLDLDADPLSTGNLLSISFRVAAGFEGSSDLLFGASPVASAAGVNATPLPFDETLDGTVTVGRVRKQ